MWRSAYVPLDPIPATKNKSPSYSSIPIKNLEECNSLILLQPVPGAWCMSDIICPWNGSSYASALIGE